MDYISLINEQKRKLFRIKGKKSRRDEQNIQTMLDEKMIIISGMRNTGKTSLLKMYIEKHEGKKDFFYFNNSYDYKKVIQSQDQLLACIKNQKKLNSNLETIILQNVFNIADIEILIKYIYTNFKKIILIGNNIEIPQVPIITTQSYRTPTSLEDIPLQIYYGNLSIVREQKDEQKKVVLLELLKNDIIHNDILFNYSIKNILLYNLIITELSKNEVFISQREFLEHILAIHNTSLKTLIDYIDFSLQAQIIKKMCRYDYKKQKHIHSKVKYYFGDTGLRNIISYQEIKKSLAVENLIYNKINKKYSQVSSLKNGNFEATFFTQNLEEPILVHIFGGNKKEDIKSDVRKILKISLPVEVKQYILVENLEEYELRKKVYDGVEIVDMYEWMLEEL